MKLVKKKKYKRTEDTMQHGVHKQSYKIFRRLLKITSNSPKFIILFLRYPDKTHFFLS